MGVVIAGVDAPGVASMRVMRKLDPVGYEVPHHSHIVLVIAPHPASPSHALPTGIHRSRPQALSLIFQWLLSSAAAAAAAAAATLESKLKFAQVHYKRTSGPADTAASSDNCTSYTRYMHIVSFVLTLQLAAGCCPWRLAE